MNKILYIFINIVAVIIALSLILFGALFVKLFGLIGLGFIVKEIISGNYKKYIT